MLEILTRLAPLYIGFFGGYLLQRLDIVDKEFGRSLLKLVFYLLLPMWIAATFSQAQITQEVLFFSLIALTIIGSGFLFTLWLSKVRSYPKPTRGVAFVAYMILNTGFALPFIAQLFDEQGLLLWGAFELVGGPTAFSIVYYIASRHSPSATTQTTALSTLLKVPVLWAIAISIALTIFSVPVPSSFLTSLGSVGGITGTVIIIAMGILFEPRLEQLTESLLLILPRLVIGILVAVSAWQLFSLSQENFAILLFLSTTPLPFNTVVFSTIHDLDSKLAVNAVSLSLIIGLITSSIIALVLI